MAEPTDSQHLTHLPALDGVRAVSIMAVVFAHTLPLTFGALTGNSISARTGMALVSNNAGIAGSSAQATPTIAAMRGKGLSIKRIALSQRLSCHATSGLARTQATAPVRATNMEITRAPPRISA